MADFPYEIDSELPLVQVVLFGKFGKTHNAAFILDTGASRYDIFKAVSLVFGSKTANYYCHVKARVVEYFASKTALFKKIF